MRLNYIVLFFFNLRSVNLCLPDGNLISEDSSIVLDHHGLLFDVSSSKQPQSLCRYHVSIMLHYVFRCLLQYKKNNI